MLSTSVTDSKPLTYPSIQPSFARCIDRSFLLPKLGATVAGTGSTLLYSATLTSLSLPHIAAAALTATLIAWVALECVQFVLDNRSLLQLVDRSDKISLCKVLYRINKQERTEIRNLCVKFQHPFKELILPVIKLLSKTPPTDRADFATELATFSKDDNVTGQLITQLSIAPSEQKLSYLTSVVNGLKRIRNRHSGTLTSESKLRFVEIILYTPGMDPILSTNIAAALATSAETQAYHSTSMRLPHELRKKFAECIIELAPKGLLESHIPHLETVPANYWDNYVSFAKAILCRKNLQLFETGYNKHIFKKLKALKPEQLRACSDFYRSGISQDPNWSWANPFFANLILPYYRFKLFTALSLYSIEDRQVLLKDVGRLKIDCTEYRVKILKQLVKMSSKERQQFLNFAEQAGYRNADLELAYRAKLYSLLTRECKDKSAPLLQQKGTFDPFTFKNFMKCLEYIPPHRRLDAILCIYITGTSNSDIFVKMLRQVATLRQDVHVYLLSQWLNDRAPDMTPQLAFERAQTVMNMADLLEIQEGHPLYEKALELVTLHHPDRQNHEQNPIKLFASLREKIASEPLLDYRSKPCVLGKQGFSLNFNKVRALAGRGFVARDLPPAIKLDTLSKLFAELNQRIESLPKEKDIQSDEQKEQVITQERLKLHVRTISEHSYESLQLGICSNPTVVNLFQERTDPTQKIENTVFYFYSILQYILDQPNVLEKGELLSKREHMLLAMAESIGNCHAGIREGTATYYVTHLPNKYKRTDKENEAPAQEQVNAMLVRGLQQALHKTFLNETMISRLVQEQKKSNFQNAPLLPVPQPFHNTLYLKNRFYRQTGFSEHEQILDPYSFCIVPELIKLSAKRFFPVFCEFLPLQFLLAEMKKSLLDEIKDSKGKFFSPLISTLEPLLGNSFKEALKQAPFIEPDPKTNHIKTQYFTYNTDFEILDLSDEILLALLKNNGLFVKA